MKTGQRYMVTSAGRRTVPAESWHPRREAGFRRAAVQRGLQGCRGDDGRDMRDFPIEFVMVSALTNEHSLLFRTSVSTGSSNGHALSLGEILGLGL